MASLALLAVLGYLLFFHGLGSFPLVGDSEGNYAEIAREMVELRDFIVPHLNYVPYIEKPPFFYWLTALTYRMIGYNEFAARLWAAIPAFGMTVIAYLLGRQLGAKRAGLLSGVILATSAGFILMAKISYMDMLFSFLISLALLMFFYGVEFRQQRYTVLCYAAMALAVLTKGFAGVILPALVIGSYIVATRRWELIRPACPFWGIIVFLAITVPWHAAIAARNGEFLWYYFVNEHLYRYLGIRYPKDYFHGPVYYHLVRLCAMLFPWSVFLPYAVYLHAKKLGKDIRWLFPAVWAIAILVFFSVSRAKANYYMLSALVPAAVIIGNVWDGAFVDLRRRIEKVFAESSFSLYVIAGFACLVLIYQYGGLFLKQFPLTFFMPAVIILFFLTLGGLAAAYFYFSARLQHAFAAFACGAFCAGAVLSQHMPALTPDRPAKDLAGIVDRECRDNDRVVIRGKFEKNSSASFYLKRRAYVVCEPGRVGGDLDFGSRYPECRQFFLDWSEFKELFGGPARIFFITHEPGDAHLLRRQGFPDAKVLYKADGRYLITNR